MQLKAADTTEGVDWIKVIGVGGYSCLPYHMQMMMMKVMMVMKVKMKVIMTMIYLLLLTCVP